MAAKQEENTLMQQELLSAVEQISEDLRMCGYKFTASASFGFISASTNSTSAHCTLEDGTSGNSTDIGYRFNAALHEIEYLNSGNATWERVTGNISNLEFTYFDKNSNIIPVIDNSTSRNIRSINISIEASASPQREQLNIPDRRMRTLIYCRNMGID